MWLLDTQYIYCKSNINGDVDNEQQVTSDILQ